MSVRVDREKLFLRNIGFINEGQQKLIQRTRVGIAGCGLGSFVAEELARFGFQVNVLADPDVVEIHNLNRQAYDLSDVGKPKVTALARRLKKINPSLNPTLFVEGVTESSARNIVDLSDIVVDCIDPSAMDMSILLHRISSQQNKFIVTALDFGWGARLYAFSPKGISLESFLGFKGEVKLADVPKIPIFDLLKNFIVDAPDYLLPIFERFSKGKLSYYPQNMIAVSQAATLILTACKKIALGEKIILAPKYYHIDPDQSLTNFDNLPL